jgi:hypothetical protein
MNSFSQIKPDKTFKTRNFTVLKKGDIYILLSKRLGAVYFIRLFDQVPVREKVIKLPIVFLGGMQFKDEISGLPVAKSRGQITIPVDITKRPNEEPEEKCVNGTGVSYLVPMYDVQHQRDLSGQFDKTVILNVMEELSNEND